jgi:hypothetical protein
MNSNAVSEALRYLGLVVAAVFLFLAGRAWVEASLMSAHAEATVQSVNDTIVTVTFFDAQGTIRNAGILCHSGGPCTASYHFGQTVQIVYDPGNPARANFSRQISHAAGWGWFAAAVGGLAVFGVGMIKPLRDRRAVRT